MPHSLSHALSADVLTHALCLLFDCCLRVVRRAGFDGIQARNIRGWQKEAGRAPGQGKPRTAAARIFPARRRSERDQYGVAGQELDEDKLGQRGLEPESVTW